MAHSGLMAARLEPLRTVQLVPMFWRLAMILSALVACQVVMVFAACYGLYQFFIALPLTPWRKRPPIENRPRHRFAILVFAKDEEQVIGNLLRSLNDQDYPDRLYDVFVTADNCVDATARRAAEHGAIVWERSDQAHIGKGHALRWFFERFRSQYASKYDACVVFDADNIVETGFLSAMNRELNRGSTIATGYRMGKNPSSSWVAGVTTLFWLFQTRFVNRARMRRDLSCLSVGGTGFMFSLDVLPSGAWNTSSTSEDIEFALDQIALGRRVDLVTDAVFYDEQPLKLGQSLSQRYRWTVGTFQSMVTCLPKLWRAREIDRFTRLDAILFCLGVPIAGINALVGVAATVLTLVWTRNWLLVAAMTLGFTLVGCLGIWWVGWLTLRLERAHWAGAWKAVLGFPVFLATWGLLYVVVLFYRSTRWNPTPHTEALELKTIAARRLIPDTDVVGVGGDEAGADAVKPATAPSYPRVNPRTRRVAGLALPK
ncbi:MAG: glycosyltransferase family 2 protein [Propionibacteriaceae bacterium]|jgi:cellulose synthase/poly-beta-1,6-N-acetylglucosamine synthase-like glycosyltransferase|nr:glycosyltransferase family 2 protein [Propionibacteriaceae bacterium]